MTQATLRSRSITEREDLVKFPRSNPPPRGKKFAKAKRLNPARGKRLIELNERLKELRAIEASGKSPDGWWAGVEYDAVRWVEAFHMVLDDEGLWDYAPWMKERDEVSERYIDLRKRWNKLVPRYLAVVRPRNMGRPLQA